MEQQEAFLIFEEPFEEGPTRPSRIALYATLESAKRAVRVSKWKYDRQYEFWHGKNETAEYFLKKMVILP